MANNSQIPLKIYMGDLTHDTVILVSDTIPINIGYIGSYAKKMYGDDIDVSLYKYPDTIIKAIQDSPPDIIALSNYSWNSNLSEMVAGLAKQANPDVITVQGGTNFPHRDELKKDFLLTRPNTDFFVELEGESSFSEIVKRVLDARDGSLDIFEQGIPGCIHILPMTRNTSEPVMLQGELPKRIKALDDIPSPYLNGMLDKFFDQRLTPFLETNRGCPFKCTFCHTGNDYFNKMNSFSLERVVAEIEYLAPKMQELGIVNLHIADTNFGMLPRDREICECFAKTRDKYNWPINIMATTGKNSKKRIIEATEILGNTFSVNMSVQSMNSNVLENINRGNIKLDDYVSINQSLQDAGRTTKGEVIIGLPGESKETFFSGVKDILEAGVGLVCSYSLMMLHGTKFKEPGYRQEFGMKGKYRIVPLNFGEYAGQRVFDIEETEIQTKDMNFDDYLSIRGFSLIVEVIHNSRPFHELFKFASTYGLSIYDFIIRVYENISSAPDKVKYVYQSFIDETKNELWDSEEELVEHYKKDENYKSLLEGKVGGNVIYKHKAMSLSYCPDEWIKFLKQICHDVILDKEPDAEARKIAIKELEQISTFATNRLHGTLQVDADTSPRHMESYYNIMDWKKTTDGTRLTEFFLEEPIVYDFIYSEDQLRARKDQFQRYGSEFNACSKIVTRVSDVQSLFREVYIEGENDDSESKSTDQFVRYTLSN